MNIIALIIAAIGSYMLFVMVSESLNPLSLPKMQSRRKPYRLGRRVGFSLFLSSLSLVFTAHLSLPLQIVICVAIALPFMVAAYLWNKRTDALGRPVDSLAYQLEDDLDQFDEFDERSVERRGDAKARRSTKVVPRQWLGDRRDPTHHDFEQFTHKLDRCLDDRD